MANDEPLITLDAHGAKITLLGTAHVSRRSAETVSRLLAEEPFDAVAVELCPSRHQSLVDPDALARMDLMRVVRERKVFMVMASLAMAAYQQRLADQFGIEPGEEQRVALREATERGLPVLLIDREIGVTLRRTAASVSWWKRWSLLAGLFGALLSREEISEQDIEALKQGDMLETTFAEFAEDRADLFEPLIAERDRYMAARLHDSIASDGHQRVLAVLGAGHVAGVAAALRDSAEPTAAIDELERLPEPSRWPKILPWAIVALLLAGFVIGFSRSPELGWQLVKDWVLINGTLSALGALLATAHPLTVVTAFVAAPLTSLNPTIGAGMVTAAAEISLRRPRVGDFASLRQDTTRPAGWWRNRVSRTLLVFLFSTLGSVAGTYLAGFRIFERLA